MYNFPHVPEARAVSSAPGECSRVSTSTMPRDMPSTTREFAQLEESMAHERKCVPLSASRRSGAFVSISISGPAGFFARRCDYHPTDQTYPFPFPG